MLTLFMKDFSSSSVSIPKKENVVDKAQVKRWF